jgi:hypothetical protein
VDECQPLSGGNHGSETGSDSFELAGSSDGGTTLSPPDAMAAALMEEASRLKVRQRRLTL